MNEDDVEVLAKDALLGGFLRVDRYQLRHRRFDGTMSETLSREVIDRGSVVAVLPIDLARRELVLVEQFRPGAYFSLMSGPPPPSGDSQMAAEPMGPWLLECIAGILDPGETPAEVAVREAQEEAGCALHDVRFVMRVFSSPASSTELAYLFLARTSTEDVGGVHGLVEEGENIRVHVVGIDDAFRWLRAGKIVNAKAILLLQWLEANVEEIERAWSTNPT